MRDVPDVSLFASYLTFGSAYLYCMTDPVDVPSCNYDTGNGLKYLADGGTSFGAPAFAGIMALVNQKTNSSQGLANYYLYSLAGKEFGSTSSPNSSQTSACKASSAPGATNSCTFYDVTEGTNALPCFIDSPNCVNGPNGYAGVLAAYNSTPGYDLVTGLGSINVENLVNNWATMAATTQATTTTLASSATLSTYGQPVTLSGTVAPVSGSGTPSGSVSIQGMQLNQASIPVVNGAFSQAVSSLLPGAYSVTASYVGDGGFLSSVSVPVSMTVGAATATDTLVFSAANVRSGAPLPSSNSQIPYGDEVVATVTVQGAPAAPGVLAPTGSITFSSNGTTLSIVPLTGNTAVYQTVAGHVGAYSLTASYSGDSNYNASPGSHTALQRGPAGTSVEAHASATAPVATGGTVTLTANVTSNSYAAPPTGTVSFSLKRSHSRHRKPDSRCRPDHLRGIGTATLNLSASQIAAGNNQIVATYTGDANFLPSTLRNLVLRQSLRRAAHPDDPDGEHHDGDQHHSGHGPGNAHSQRCSRSAWFGQLPRQRQLIAQVPVVGLAPAAGASPGTAELITRLTPGNPQYCGHLQRRR